MTATASRTSLDFAAIHRLSNVPGPCLSVIVPESHPGGQTGSHPVHLHNALRSLRESLERSVPASASELLEPFEKAAAAEREGGGAGFTLFGAPGFFARFDADAPGGQEAIVASHFHLAPFVAATLVPGEFFILGLSRKHLRLLRYSGDECEEVELPSRVPTSLEAAGAFDRPDHNLENRSAVGTSLGGMRALRFGTGTDRESDGDYMANFFGKVDQELHQLLPSRRILLMGVEEEVRLYRKVAKHNRLLDSEIAGNGDLLSTHEIAARAAAGAAEHQRRHAGRLLDQFREIDDPAQKSSDIRSIVRAASRGRIHRLCARAQTRFIGPMWPELDSARQPGEDLLNAAVVETIRTGGDVVIVPEDMMSPEEPLVAILRY